MRVCVCVCVRVCVCVCVSEIAYLYFCTDATRLAHLQACHATKPIDFAQGDMERYIVGERGTSKLHHSLIFILKLDHET